MKRLIMLLGALLFVGSMGTAYAQDSGFTEQDLKDINNQTAWYGPNIDGCTIDAGAGTVTGDNIKDTFLWFMEAPRNLSAIQSAGIVGNLIQESGVNPRSNQAGGPGMGIAQWSEGGRWEELKKWVAVNNLGDIYSLPAQWAFLWHEMESVAPWDQTLPAIRATTTVEDATIVFEEKFEKAGIPNMPRRIANAKLVLERFGSLAPASAGSTETTSTTAASEDSLCGASGTGNVNTQGYSFPVADQKKHSYSTLPCTKTTCHWDGTYGFDLMYGSNGNMDGKAVYAITAGTIVKQGVYHGVPGCYSIQFKSDLTNGRGSWYYWYGHLQNPKFSVNQHVNAGQQIAEIGAFSLGSNCRGGRDHLHIDRGCVQGGIPQTAGSDECRDGAFVPLLQKMWEELPE